MQDQKSSSACEEEASEGPSGIMDRWCDKSRACLAQPLQCLPDVLVDLIGSYLPARLQFKLERFVPVGMELFHMCYCDGKVAIVTDENELTILDGEQYGLIGMIPIEDDPDHPPCDILSIYYISDGVVVVALRSGSLFFYDVSTDQPVLVGLLKPKQLHEQFGVRALKRLSDGRLATGGGNASIKMWQLDDADDGWTKAKCVKTMVGHTKEITCLQQIGSAILASGSADNNIVLWDAATGECLQTLTGHTRSVTCLVDLGCERFASGSWDKDIRIWQITGECIRIINIGAYGYVRNLIIDDGFLVCHPFASRSLLVYDSATGAKSFDVITMIDYVHALLVLPNGRLFVGGSKSGANAQGAIEEWD